MQIAIRSPPMKSIILILLTFTLLRATARGDEPDRPALVEPAAAARARVEYRRATRLWIGGLSAFGAGYLASVSWGAQRWLDGSVSSEELALLQLPVAGPIIDAALYLDERRGHDSANNVAQAVFLIA